MVVKKETKRFGLLKIEAYHCISGTTLPELEKLVETKIREKYVPYGNLIYNTDTKKYIQVMVKYKG